MSSSPILGKVPEGKRGALHARLQHPGVAAAMSRALGRAEGKHREGPVPLSKYAVHDKLAAELLDLAARVKEGRAVRWGRTNTHTLVRGLRDVHTFYRTVVCMSAVASDEDIAAMQAQLQTQVYRQMERLIVAVYKAYVAYTPTPHFFPHTPLFDNPSHHSAVSFLYGPHIVALVILFTFFVKGEVAALVTAEERDDMQRKFDRSVHHCCENEVTRDPDPVAQKKSIQYVNWCLEAVYAVQCMGMDRECTLNVPQRRLPAPLEAAWMLVGARRGVNDARNDMSVWHNRFLRIKEIEERGPTYRPANPPQWWRDHRVKGIIQQGGVVSIHDLSTALVDTIRLPLGQSPSPTNHDLSALHVGARAVHTLLRPLLIPSEGMDALLGAHFFRSGLGCIAWERNRSPHGKGIGAASLPVGTRRKGLDGAMWRVGVEAMTGSRIWESCKRKREE